MRKYGWLLTTAFLVMAVAPGVTFADPQQEADDAAAKAGAALYAADTKLFNAYLAYLSLLDAQSKLQTRWAAVVGDATPQDAAKASFLIGSFDSPSDQAYSTIFDEAAPAEDDCLKLDSDAWEWYEEMPPNYILAKAIWDDEYDYIINTMNPWTDLAIYYNGKCSGINSELDALCKKYE